MNIIQNLLNANAFYIDTDIPQIFTKFDDLLNSVNFNKIAMRLSVPLGLELKPRLLKIDYEK